MIGQANGVLRERRIFITVRMAQSGAEALQVVVRHLMRVRAQRRQLQSAEQRLEGKRIDLDGVEDKLAAEGSGKIVSYLRQQQVAAKFP